MKEGYDKEPVYDEKIAPLMQQIINICKAEQIPMVASFYLTSEDAHPSGKPLFCTTTLPVKDNTPEWISDVIRTFQHRRQSIGGSSDA